MSVPVQHVAEQEKRFDTSQQIQAVRPPSRLTVLNMFFISMIGLASCFVAQALGASFRVSLIVGAAMVGICVPLFHHFYSSSRQSVAPIPPKSIDELTVREVSKTEVTIIHRERT